MSSDGKIVWLRRDGVYICIKESGDFDMIRCTKSKMRAIWYDVGSMVGSPHHRWRNEDEDLYKRLRDNYSRYKSDPVRCAEAFFSIPEDRFKGDKYTEQSSLWKEYVCDLSNQALLRLSFTPKVCDLLLDRGIQGPGFDKNEPNAWACADGNFLFLEGDDACRTWVWYNQARWTTPSKGKEQCFMFIPIDGTSGRAIGLESISAAGFPPIVSRIIADYLPIFQYLSLLT